MKTVRLTTAQALIKFLGNQYVEFDGQKQRFIKGMFTVFGHGNVLGIGQALEQDSCGLIVHQGRNEQGMAHAAIAYAKQKHRRQIYCCTSSIGPGAANMLTAAATATANRIPVLFLPGDTYASRQPDPVLQQIEHFHDVSITTNDAFRSVSKFWDRIHRPEQIMWSAINALRVLTDPAETGAVTLALPQDVQAEAYDFPIDFFAHRVHRIERRLPTSEMLQDAVELIIHKKKPILICGGGVRYSEAHEAFKTFAETFRIPFAETQAGKSAVIWDHDLNLGGIGVTGCMAANIIAKEADLVIGVGTRYTDFTTSSKWLFQNSDVKFININISPFDAYKLDSIKVVADARVALEALKDKLRVSGYKSSYTDEIEQAKHMWTVESDRLSNIMFDDGFVAESAQHRTDVSDKKILHEFADKFGSYLAQTRALGMINNYIDVHSIVVGSSGSLPGDMQRMWKAKAINSYHMEYGYSCMGYEINGALGVKLAEPDYEVYAMVGDGSYMMLHSELPTSIQEGKKINVIVFDNASFGCINSLQTGHGMGSFGTEFRLRNIETGNLNGNFIYTDFAKNAESYGCKSYRVTNEIELLKALEDAKRQTVSTLIDIKVLPMTMTHGYESWWRVGCAEVSENSVINSISSNIKEQVQRIKKY